MPEEENIDGVIVHRLNSARKNREHCSFGEMMSYLLKAMPYSKKLHEAYEFDICMVFFGIPSGPIGYVIKKKYKLPYIIRFGGGDIPGFQDRFSVIYKLIAPVIKTIWKNADALVANSDGLRKMALEFYDKREFEVISNGVDSEYFRPAEFKSYSKEVRILFVSRLIERKGLQHIIPYLDKIEEISGRQIILTVVGDGPYRASLERIVQEYGFGNIVKFVGQKSREDILAYYQEADVFILPSKKEGMPNVVLEAMACGLPVVMTPCQGSQELIEGNGYISELDNFIVTLSNLVADDKLRNQFGSVSRERTERLFSWNTTADRYLEIANRAVKA